MRLLISPQKLQLFVLVIFMSTAMSCGSFQYAGNIHDDIYNDDDEVVYVESKNIAPLEEKVNYDDSSDYYRNLLKDKASQYGSEDDIITDVDHYSSAYYDEDEESDDAYSGWGQESDQVNVNIYTNSYYGYSPFWRPRFYRPWNWTFGYNSWNFGYDYWGPGFYPPISPWYQPYYYGGFYPNYYGHPFYGYPYYGSNFNNGFYGGGRDIVFTNGHRGGRGVSNSGLLSASSRESFNRTMSRATRGSRSSSNSRPASSSINNSQRPRNGASRNGVSSRPSATSRPNNASRPSTTRPSSSSRPSTVRPNNSSRPVSSPRVNRSSRRRGDNNNQANNNTNIRPSSNTISTNTVPRNSSSSFSKGSSSGASRGSSGGRRGNN